MLCHRISPWCSQQLVHASCTLLSCAGHSVYCDLSEVEQKQGHLQQYQSYLPGQQDTAGFDSTSHLRPGYKWDQFLPIKETTPAQSKLKAFLTKLFPSWLFVSKPSPSAHSQPQSAYDDDEPVALDNATWVPVLPAAFAWMMHDAQDRIDKSGIKLPKAQLLAKLTSVSYCDRTNIKAWNCTRYVVLCLPQHGFCAYDMFG